MKNLSGGNVALALACQSWLRDDFEHEKTPPTNPMKFGNAVHRCIEADIKGERVDIRAFIDAEQLRGPSWPGKVERRYDAWCKWAAKRNREGWLAEKAIAYHVHKDTARWLPDGRGWQKYKDVDRASEIPLVIDLLVPPLDGVVEVWDWKTGRVNFEKDKPQARACGLGAARLYGVDRARVNLLYSREIGRASCRERV